MADREQDFDACLIKLADAYVRFATKHSALIGLMFAAKHQAAGASRANQANRQTRLSQDLLPSQKGKPAAW